MGIIYSDQADVHEYDKGVRVKKLAVPETGTESISVGVATFEPGVSCLVIFTTARSRSPSSRARPSWIWRQANSYEAL